MVNGYHVGEHQGGYTAFTFELTRFLKYGQSNSLWVIVNNAPLMDVMPTAGDINIYGGLYRDVELIVTEPTPRLGHRPLVRRYLPGPNAECRRNGPKSTPLSISTADAIRT